MLENNLEIYIIISLTCLTSRKFGRMDFYFVKCFFFFFNLKIVPEFQILDAAVTLSILNFLSVLGDKFEKYLEAFKPYLLLGLKNYAEYQVNTRQLFNC